MISTITPQVATADLDTPRAHARIGVAVTPLGLLAAGGLVAAILLSVPPIIRAGARAAAAR